MVEEPIDEEAPEALKGSFGSRWQTHPKKEIPTGKSTGH
jgi:hypothetical protein